jgi:hypothetical protein
MDTFKLVAEVHRQIEEVNQRAKVVVKKFYRNADDLAAFIEQRSTPVYVIQGGLLAKLTICALGFEPGFIPKPDKPAMLKRYRTLTRLLAFQGIKPGCSFDYGVFVVTKELYTVGYLAHQLHHWLSCRAGLPGYNDESQKQYQKFWNEHNGIIGPEIEKMTAHEIISLKNAVDRDLEALKFIRQVTDEIFVPAQQGRNFAQGGATG